METNKEQPNELLPKKEDMSLCYIDRPDPGSIVNDDMPLKEQPSTKQELQDQIYRNSVEEVRVICSQLTIEERSTLLDEIRQDLFREIKEEISKQSQVQLDHQNALERLHGHLHKLTMQ